VNRFVITLVLVLGIFPAASSSNSLDLIPPVDGPISRHFEAPSTPYSAGHRGIDFTTAFGSPVVASASGTVTFAGQVGGSLFVSVDHPGGLRTTYSFLSAVLVKKGQIVAQGAIVARSGLGHAAQDPPHLHFGIRSGDAYLDPEPMLLGSMRRNIWRVIHLAPPA
jgi:murein DD-endopeptidase MepM/ murein hydrolase activator NlpD